jgi:hypothetical protein
VSSAIPAESWEQWASRVTAELAGLADGEWLTVTAAPAVASGSPGGPDGTAFAPSAAEPAERARRWSLRRGSPATSADTRSSMADVFLQARRVGGVLALECISDTEFEGLSDLSREQERALLALGWGQDDHEPGFHRTYAPESSVVEGTDVTEDRRDLGEPGDGGDPGDPGDPGDGADHARGAATEAARLLRDSLEKALGAPSPESVVLHRSAARER